MRIEFRLTLATILVLLTIISVNCIGCNQRSPDETIQVNADSNMILTGGQTTWVTAQLYYKGEPLKKAGINVTFSCNDSSRATLPSINCYVTDDGGSTKIPLTSGDMPGQVKITAFYNDGNGTVANASYVNVSRWGNIGGLVIDEHGINIPNANVSLWNCHYHSATHQWVKDDILHIPENPQLSNGGRTGYAGQFAFYRVPIGMYILMADKEGHNNTTVVTLEQGTATGIVHLPGYVSLAFNSSTMGIPSPTHNGNEIWGMVCDQNKVSIPNVNVSLWHSIYNQTVGQWEKTTMVEILENPRKSDNNTVRFGEYRFENLPPGTYYVLADDQGHRYYAIVHLNSEQSIAYIVLPDWERPPPFWPSTYPPPI